MARNKHQNLGSENQLASNGIKVKFKRFGVSVAEFIKELDGMTECGYFSDVR